MAYEFHYTPTGTGVISGKEVLEQTEDAINDLGNTAISGVQEALDKAEQALTNSANAVDDAQTALNTANNAEGVAIQAQTDVGNLSGTVTNIGNRVTTAEGNISNLQGRMTTAEGNISGLNTRMGTAEGNITTLQSNVSTAQATANSAQQTATTARQQSYVFRYSGTAVVPNSTIAYSTIDNTDNIKSGDKILDVDGKLFEITAVDTANQTVTVGSALIDLALDSNVVHTSGNETVNGEKVFGDVSTFDGSYIGNEASTNGRTVQILESNRDTHGQSGLLLTKFRQNKAQGALSGNDVVYFTLDVLENSVRTNAVFRFNFRDFVNDVPQDIAFYPTGLKNSLGGSAGGPSNNKWHLINGINPGSLSLPDLNNGIDISGYITDLTGASNINKYTPLANGWISIGLYSAEFIELYIPSNLMGGTFTKSTSNSFATGFLPALANTEIRITLKGSSLRWAKFYPSLGNV